MKMRRKVTNVGGGKLGIYLGPDVVREMGLRGGTPIDVEVVSKRVMIVTVVER
jgi:hypothetical protein